MFRFDTSPLVHQCPLVATMRLCRVTNSSLYEKKQKKITSKNLQMIISQRTKVKLKIRHLNDIFFSFKFGIIGFWGIKNLQKKFGDFILKFVDFSLLSNFCQSLALTKTKKLTSKSWTLEKNPQILRQMHQTFVASCQYPKPQPYQFWWSNSAVY